MHDSNIKTGIMNYKPRDTMYAFPEGLEDVLIDGNARKVMIDGTLYIVRENGIFTVTGARVK